MHLVQLDDPCNNACVFCNVNAPREAAVGRPTSQHSAIVDELRGLERGAAVALVGGEPTRSAGLLPALEVARDRGLVVVVQTNARDLSEGALAQQLKALGVASLDVSLHGPNASIHEYHTGVEGSFKQTVAGIRQARAAHLPVAITSVVTRSNFRHLDELVTVAAHLRARALQLSVVAPEGRAATRSAALVPARAMVRPFLLKALRVAQRHRLAVVSGKHATDPDARRWFAGRVQPPVGESNPTAHSPPQPLRLPVLATSAEVADSAAAAGLAS